jgi:hypothetical protein
MIPLPYDPESPPAEPPWGVERMLWNISYSLRVSHVPNTDGFCQSPGCVREFALWPCQPVRLADAGLLASVGWWTLPGKATSTDEPGHPRLGRHPAVPR